MRLARHTLEFVRAAFSGEYGIGAKPGIDASNSTASARHDRGWSVARMIDSRAGATRMVDMIGKVDRWVSAPWCAYGNWPIG
jgi:hypothetical protein